MKRKPKPVIQCGACKEKFQYNCQLKYHIRRHHFNLVDIAPHYETRNVNDVWVEGVVYTDDLVEIEKAGENFLLIKKVKDPDVQPTELVEEVNDVREQYPLKGKPNTDKISCRVCQKLFGGRLLAKHFAISHPELVKKRCDLCDVRFKRLMQCATHVCSASINKKLKKENDEWTVID